MRLYEREQENESDRQREREKERERDREREREREQQGHEPSIPMTFFPERNEERPTTILNLKEDRCFTEDSATH